MGNIINIAFQGGTHGHFLRFTLDKYSGLTKPLEGTPFTENGTSHNDHVCSEEIVEYHPAMKGQDCFRNINEPHILITVEESDLLTLERTVTLRANDYKINTSQDIINLSDMFLEHFPWADAFMKYYRLDIKRTKQVPKCLMRDFYKLSFLDPEHNGFLVRDRRWRKNKPQSTFEFPVSHFWDKAKFLNKLKEVDQMFSLQLDLSDLSMHDEFIKRMPVLKTRHRAEMVVDCIKLGKDISITDIDTVEQAYISAWIERNNDFILVPFSNDFFGSTGEIIEWINYYPPHYKAMNPNLPTFNGIPNPYHLAKLKK